MTFLRAVVILEALLLFGSGILCLALPTLINTETSETDFIQTYIRCALGLALIALAILLVQIITEVGKFQKLLLTYLLFPGACILGVATVNSLYGFGGPSVLLWMAGIVLTIIPFLIRITFAQVAAAAAPAEVVSLPVLPVLSAGKSDNRDALKLHEARMKYAWDWFQYHADQRLKAFNYFVVVLGILIAAFGATMKEAATSNSSSFRAFAGAVALCGVFISVAFYFIEVRNMELVECGRKWLDYLEPALGMSLRRDDKYRAHLPLARGALLWRVPNYFITHKLWIRFIYGLSFVGFVLSLGFVCWGLK